MMTEEPLFVLTKDEDEKRRRGLSYTKESITNSLYSSLSRMRERRE
jgi:hypothetical protein